MVYRGVEMWSAADEYFLDLVFQCVCSSELCRIFQAQPMGLLKESAAVGRNNC